MSEKKKWDGKLKFNFAHQRNNIFYYNVDICLGKRNRNFIFKEKKVSFTIPRYEPMIGWIEVFGLPPQNEWVILGDLGKYWHKKGELIIKDEKRKIEENLEIFNNNEGEWRLIKFARKMGDIFENQICLEDWSGFKINKYIKKRTVFHHSGGVYYVTMDAYYDPRESFFNEREKLYTRDIIKEKGKPSLGIWFKKFSVSGDPLPIYSKLFPFWGNEWQYSQGRIVEIGYEKEMMHGDWFKLFEIGERKFEIEEDGWTSREAEWQDKKVRIKNTYEKRIREIF